MVPPVVDPRNPVQCQAMTESPRRTAENLPGTVLGVLSIGVLLLGTAWVLSPFLFALVWATMIVVATWPLLIAAQARLGGRRGAAVAVMTFALLLVLIVPLGYAILSIVEHSDDISRWSESLTRLDVPPAPGWLEKIPFAGPKIAERWGRLASATPEEISQKLSPYARDSLAWVLEKIGGVGRTTIQFLLTVMIAAILYASGETAARGVRRFAHRLAGERGDSAVVLAGQAIRAVALGIIVTAIVQAVVAGIGLAIVGVPYAGLLTGVVFLLGIAQLGAGFVLVPATIWVFYRGDTGWGAAMVVFTILMSFLDNILRPMLIRRGADLPLILIMAGVIGGLLGFGIIGLFVGPVVLAVTYTLTIAWIEAGEKAEAVPALAAAAEAPARPLTAASVR
jgi:predicted PurR-regulated permease PerM